MGSSQVDYVDHDRKRLEIAESLGANPTQVPKATAWLAKNVPAREDRYLISVDATASPYGIRLIPRLGT
jgi:hypothetical protein